MKRVRLLDGLRAVAALLVLVSHVAFWTGASGLDVVGGLLARGDSGVAVFFALSSYLLLMPWVRHGLLDAPRPGTRRYAVRRMARILPAYWLALLAVLAVAALAASTGGLGSAAKVLGHVLVLQGFSGDTYQSFTQTWSLTTELVFYVLVPFVGAALARVLRRGGGAVGVRPALLLCGVAAVVGLAAQGVSMSWTQHGSTTGAGALATSVIGHAAWFAVGAALAIMSVARSAGALPWQAGGRVAAWLDLLRSPSTCLLGAVVVYVVAASAVAGPRDLSAPTVGEGVAKELLYALLAALLLSAALAPAEAGSLADSIGRHPATHWLGDVSYGVFLWHVLVLQVLFLTTGRELFSGGFWWVLLPVLGLTTALASVSAQLVEQPVLRWAHRATASAPAARA
ncbi:acyltransferase family protein [Luteipulveratus halotolerans]|uniref:acyltransferase family protein n=1 Tax=Luteipulveratus halotolerans TaxID=1631356 RepID=UPI0008FC1365|nr:acyltransferase family protein [Luteipulveratus halotolerans]